MAKYSFKQRFQYFFDNTMSRGTIALVAWLAVLSFFVILISGIGVTILNLQPADEDIGFFEALWQGTLRTLDAGTMAGDQGIGYRAISFIVTLGGIFIISTFIGVVSSGLESKIEDLRKGRSLVIEENHTVILGWSSKIFTLISEIALANKSVGGGVVVVLADRDKVEMEDDIRAHLPDLHGTKVICRSGSPHDMDDLPIVNPHLARSIILIAGEEDNSDAQIIKSILALNNIRQAHQKPYHIVAEIKRQRNLEVARMVGKGEVELVFADEITARIMVQSSRQTGLSLVYSNLMDFDGVEIYFKEEKALVGKTYSECLNAYEHSAVMGVQYASGEVEVNPPMDYRLKAGDQLMVIAEDDNSFSIQDKSSTAKGEVVVIPVPKKPAERSLLLGWNHRARIVIQEMDNYASPGSFLKVVASSESAVKEIAEIRPNLKNVELEFLEEDTTDREVLESLGIHEFDYILLLCYQHDMELQEADAETLITLLHLRRIFDERGQRANVVSEMLDLRNCELAQITRADDFIVSDKLISLLITQVAENKGLMRVFDSLFSADGSEIYLKPAQNYVKTGVPTNFYTVLDSARRRNETAIGYRLMAQAEDVNHTYGVHLNPIKTADFVLTDKDYVIVIAES